MAPEVAEVERALLALAPEERAAVIHMGLLSLDGAPAETSQDEIDAAWRTEVAGRLDDVIEGRVQLGSFEATRARFVAMYPRPRGDR
ncbi:addiction module protein [Pseudactinotalea sp. HY160]|uniref:addiction module protein n=1 Tax=Pseudactinotalea sp. HY160 TaxID=2654490 RepID=UPI00128B7257|nr:addiction module protein [Pseudactinotalea sp. HY160]MPV50667.1 addiction module protein [Pseudactinotalea sp. HY160]